MVLRLIAPIFLVSSFFAQEPAKVQEPEYLNVFFALAPGRSLKPLERQTAKSQVKVKAMGFGGGKSVMYIDGTQSPMRLTSDSNLAFIVKLDTHGNDPSTLIWLYSLTSGKDRREMVVAKAGSMGHSARTVDDSRVEFNVAKYGENSYKVVPVQPLPPGEYALSSAPSIGYCFGIDK